MKLNSSHLFLFGLVVMSACALKPVVAEHYPSEHPSGCLLNFVDGKGQGCTIHDADAHFRNLGLENRDLLVRVDDQAIASVADEGAALSRMARGANELLIQRDGKRMILPLAKR